MSLVSSRLSSVRNPIHSKTVESEESACLTIGRAAKVKIWANLYFILDQATTG